MLTMTLQVTDNLLQITKGRVYCEALVVQHYVIVCPYRVLFERELIFSSPDGECKLTG